MESKSLNASKIVFLKALKERLPFAEPIRTGLHAPMWFCDFLFEGPLDDQIIPLLEETMRKIVKEDTEIKTQEMILSNAIEYWKHHKNFEKSESYEGEEDRVLRFLLLDKILEEFEEEAPLSTSEAKDLHLYSVTKIDDHFYRVWGGGFKKNIYQKSYKHEPIVQELEEGRGLLWKKRESTQLLGLVKYLLNECEKEKISYLFTPPVGDKFRWHLELFKGSKAVYWRSFEIEQAYQVQKNAYLDNPFTTNFPMRDRQFRFFHHEKMVQELISSLQFIERTTTIFGLNGQWHICLGPQFSSQKRRFDKLLKWVHEAMSKSNIKAIETKTSESVSGLSIEFHLVDSVGRKWPGSLIELLDQPIVTQDSEYEGIKLSVFQSFERWMSFFEN